VGHLWAFENAAARVQTGSELSCLIYCFQKGDTVALELERQEGLEGVLRVRAKGRACSGAAGAARQRAAFIVLICIVDDRRKVAMVPVP